jgi:hypothetical protein
MRYDHPDSRALLAPKAPNPIEVAERKRLARDYNSPGMQALLNPRPPPPATPVTAGKPGDVARARMAKLYDSLDMQRVAAMPPTRK